MCSNGIPGIESSKGACCVAECGQCGGMGCSTVARDLGLGSAECCEDTILENNKPCGEAPCVVGGVYVLLYKARYSCYSSQQGEGCVLRKRRVCRTQQRQFKGNKKHGRMW